MLHIHDWPLIFEIMNNKNEINVNVEILLTKLKFMLNKIYLDLTPGFFFLGHNKKIGIKRAGLEYFLELKIAKLQF